MQELPFRIFPLIFVKIASNVTNPSRQLGVQFVLSELAAEVADRNR
jgi:hypothetical protein